MYMLTKGNSGIPLIKLTEGHSINSKCEFVTTVCGTNGEKLKPIKLWETPFTFFNKEMLNAEFVSKTELIYILITKYSNSFVIEVDKYSVPSAIQGMLSIEIDAVRSFKPTITNVFKLEIDKFGDCVNYDLLHSMLNNLYEGKYRDAVLCSFLKFFERDKICYAKI